MFVLFLFCDYAIFYSLYCEVTYYYYIEAKVHCKMFPLPCRYKAIDLVPFSDCFFAYVCRICHLYLYFLFSIYATMWIDWFHIQVR